MKNRKKKQLEKLGNHGPLRRSEGLPRHGEAEGPGCPLPLGLSKA